MRTLAFLKKTFLENLREWKILSLTLVFAPFFVYLMYGYYHASPSTYTLVVVNRDATAGPAKAPGRRAAEDLIAAWNSATRPDGGRFFQVIEVPTTEEAIRKVAAREADLAVEIPAGFSEGLDAFASGAAAAPPHITNRASQSNLRSTVAMAYSDYLAFQVAYARAKTVLPLGVSVAPVGGTRELSEFDLYVPALLVLALIMVLFTAAATLIKEVDKRTMSRLMLSRLRTTEFLAAVTVNQVLIGLVTLLLAYLAALSVGYEPQGSLAPLLVVAAVSTVAVVALSVLVAAFLNTIFELLTVGCFPFFVLMFFSDAMIPLPKIPLFHVAGHVVNAADVLPTSLSVRAFGAILSDGVGLAGVRFELAGIVVLTVVYFALGSWLFRRRHMSVR
jgi:ABC-2 type transport system permease protein